MNRLHVLEEIVGQLVEIVADEFHEHGFYERSGDLARLAAMLEHEQEPWERVKELERFTEKLRDFIRDQANIRTPSPTVKLPDDLTRELWELKR